MAQSAALRCALLPVRRSERTGPQRTAAQPTKPALHGAIRSADGNQWRECKQRANIPAKYDATGCQIILIVPTKINRRNFRRTREVGSEFWGELRVTRDEYR